jgi:DNA-directed RNA polymerase subunit RPC12/RpoP
MSYASRRRVLAGGLFGAACACVAPRLAFAADSPSGKYVCPPCGCSAEGKEFDKAGDCPACGMPLMPKPEGEPKPKPQRTARTAEPQPKTRRAQA